MNAAYDVIVIGTGAGGGTLAYHLASTGKRILLLERGDYLPREPQNWSAADVFVDNRYIPPDTWTDDKGKAFQPQIHYYDGISPAWPISYGDMEPYYTRAEHLYQVHGDHGEDPSEGPASAQYNR